MLRGLHLKRPNCFEETNLQSGSAKQAQVEEKKRYVLSCGIQFWQFMFVYSVYNQIPFSATGWFERNNILSKEISA